MKLPISKLVNNTGQIEGLPANPRTINKDDYQKLLKSLQDDPDFLNHKPLHVYEHDGKYIVLGGNQRLKALKELGHKDVPVTIYDPETPVEVLKRRIIVDNSTFGDYDMDMLANEWDSEPLGDWGVDLPDDWLKQDDEVVEDEAPEVDESEPPKSKLGEIYQLGRHRVMCADSTVRENVELLMNGEKADMVFTDPPYGIAYSSSKFDGNTKGVTNVRNKAEMIIGDEQDFDPSFLLSMFKSAKEMFVWGYQYYPEKLGRGGIIVWNKKQETEVDNPHGDFELCWSRNERNKMCWLRWGGFNNKEQGEDRLHTTQKPVALAQWFFKNWGKDLNNVVDLFLGSGSTIIACEQTDRTCFGMELSESYTDVVRKRWAKYVYPDRWEEEWEQLTPVIET